jgi:hypothetical protein
VEALGDVSGERFTPSACSVGEDDNEENLLSSKRYGGKVGWVGPTRARGKKSRRWAEREEKGQRERDGPPGKRGRGLPAGPSQAWLVGRSAPFLFLF